MAGFENTALILLAILCAGLLIPELFRKLKLPFVSSLILVGALAGPHTLDLVPQNEVIEFFGFLGSAFLMLLAGLEVKTAHLETLKRKVFAMAAMNGLVPFAAGITIMRLLGYSWFQSVLVGIIFISSSVAIVATSVKTAKLATKRIGEVIISSAVLMDVFSLLLLAFVLQSVKPLTIFPLPVYFIILVVSLVVLWRVLPLLTRWYCIHVLNEHSIHKEYEDELHFVIVLLIGVLVYFSFLGVHPIVAGFLVGLLLSGVMRSDVLYEKFHTLGYGLFVPVFFFVVGMQMDLSIVMGFDYRNVVLWSLVLGSVGAKLLSGYWGARVVGFSRRNASFFGVASTAQLTTTLAVTYAVASLGVLDEAVITAMLVIAMVTTFFSPIALNAIRQRG